MRVFRCLKNNHGTSIIILVLMLTIIAGSSAIVVDIGNIIVEKSKLQNAIDSTSLAASQELPNVQAATEVANHYIQKNGYSPSDIKITFSNSNSQIDIEGTKEVKFFFAPLLGFDSRNTTCKAGAVAQNIGQALDYVLFSGSTTTNLNINGSGCFVDGNSHTNYNFIANGSKQTITGACEAVKNVTVNGSQMDINNRIPNAPYVDMPDFSETIRLQAENAGTLYNSNKTFSGSYSIDTSIYVNGNVVVNGSHFRGKGCILATGSITFNGSNLYESTSDAVCFYSKNGNITINGSNAQLDGIVYAPNGSITLNGSNQNVEGRVIGKTLTFNGNGFTVNGNSNDLKSLPSKGAKLVK